MTWRVRHTDADGGSLVALHDVLRAHIASLFRCDAAVFLCWQDNRSDADGGPYSSADEILAAYLGHVARNRVDVYFCARHLLRFVAVAEPAYGRHSLRWARI